jgi:5-formyltetrahydrofolate cyclo-ligase
MDTEKTLIRQRAKKFRDQMQISPEWSQEAAQNFINVTPLADGKIVSAYYPIGSEIDPSPIVEMLWQRNVTVCLPFIIQGERGLKFIKWARETKLELGKFGTMMPEDSADYIAPDILIVPLLAFDQTGNRMGYGQGHYDETIRLLRQEKEVLSVGLAYAEQAVLLALPTEPHDQKLDLVITPQRVFDFRP